MTTVVPRRVPNTNPDPEAPLVATAVSNTCVEVMTHLWNPGDVELVSVLTTQTNKPSPQTSVLSSSPDKTIRSIEDATALTDRSIVGGTAVGGGRTPSPLPAPPPGPARHANDPPSQSIAVNSHEQAWQRLITLTALKDELPSLIETIVSDSEMANVVDHLRRSDAQVFIDAIDGALDDPKLVPPIRNKCVKLLYEMCARYFLVPRSLDIELSHDLAGVPRSRGGFADLWKVECRGREVGVKVLRTCAKSDLQEITHGFCREFVTWKVLHHPNVLPLLGVIMTEGRFLMVSEWMANGNINQFVTAHRDANRFALLGDVVRGLIYMHSEGMVHGDLKGVNILIDQTCHARLADFGLTTISDSISTNSCAQGGTTRWMSPELLGPEIQDHHQTKYSDCYALGMVIYEVLSGRVPFSGCTSYAAAVKVLGGERPQRPEGAEGIWLIGDVWKTLEYCWKPEPSERPSIEHVLKCLEGASRFWTSPPLVPSIIGSLTRETSGVMAVEGTDEGGVSSPLQVAPSQPTEQPNLEGSAGPVNRASSNPIGEHPFRASDPSPTQRLSRETVGKVRTEPNNLSSGDDRGETLPGPTAQPNAKSAAGGSDYPATSASKLLTVVANWDGKSRDISQVLAAAFKADHYLSCVKNLQAWNVEPSLYINNLDKIIDTLPTNSELQKQCIRALRKTCGLYGILPACYEITFALSKHSLRRPFASGGCADVWKYWDEKGQVFGVKSLRTYEHDPVEEINQQYCKEVVVCKRVKHPNILSIEGVAPKLFEFCMVSQWMAGGDMLRYIERHPDVNRLGLLIGVARGLGYLHDNGVVHGDLKSGNILIDAKGSPRLSDFGCCSITKDNDSVNASTPDHGGTLRFWAPELFEPRDVTSRRPTNKSDMYSLSMVIVELVTGKKPFPEVTVDNIVILSVLKGKRPSTPTCFEAPGMSRAVWKVAKKCWRHEANERPEVSAVLLHLEDIANTYGCAHDACSCSPWELVDGVDDKRAPFSFRRLWRVVFCK